MGCEWSSARQIQIFREYLQIPTAHPNPNYIPCIKLIRRLAFSLQLPLQIFYPGGPNKPILLLTWRGTQPHLPSILLNSHMDVVPAIDEQWTYPPFSAHIDREGRIYARGSQDMKSVGIQYLAAIKKLRSKGVKLKRTIHVLFVPDEEVGGVLGMEVFTQTKQFKLLNVGFALDEAAASENETFYVTYGERTIWQIALICHGPTAHGSTLVKDTAGEKLNRITTKIMDFRQTQIDRLDNDSTLVPSDVSSVNLTLVRGGNQVNVIPPTIIATYDIRLAHDIDLDEFEKQIHEWCDEAGGGIDVVFVQKGSYIPPTNLDDSNLFWLAFRDAMTVDLNLSINTLIGTGTTDVRFLRKLGIPALGFSPMNNTPMLLHANNEFLKISTFLKGVDIYTAIIQRIGNV